MKQINIVLRRKEVPIFHVSSFSNFANFSMLVSVLYACLAKSTILNYENHMIYFFPVETWVLVWDHRLKLNQTAR